MAEITSFCLSEKASSRDLSVSARSPAIAACRECLLHLRQDYSVEDYWPTRCARSAGEEDSCFAEVLFKKNIFVISV